MNGEDSVPRQAKDVRILKLSAVEIMLHFSLTELRCSNPRRAPDEGNEGTIRAWIDAEQEQQARNRKYSQHQNLNQVRKRKAQAETR